MPSTFGHPPRNNSRHPDGEGSRQARIYHYQGSEAHYDPQRPYNYGHYRNEYPSCDSSYLVPDSPPIPVHAYNPEYKV